MQPRRRAATYGKASRKAASDLCQSATNAFAQISHLDERTQKAGLSPVRDQPSESRILEAQGALEPQIPRYPVASLDRILYTPVEAVESTEANLSSTSERPDTLYDVPSSEDSLEAKQDVCVNSRRKRRKITSKLRPHTVPSRERLAPLPVCHKTQPGSVVPQRPVENTAVVQKSTTGNHRGNDVLEHAGSSLETQDSKVPQPRYSLNQFMSTDHDALKAATFPGKSFSKPTKSHLPSNVTTDGTLPSMGFNGALGMSSSAEEPHYANKGITSDAQNGSHTNRHREVTEPLTPPKQSRPTSHVTTPHQRAVWSLLLPADTSRGSPSCLNLPKLRLSDAETPSPTDSTKNVLTSYREVRGVADVPRRRRIVDTLQSQASEPHREIVPDDGFGNDADHSQTDDDPGKCTKSSKGHPRRQDHSNDDEVRDPTSTSTNQQDRNASYSVPVLQGGGLMVTYARQRSYLTESDFSETAIYDKIEPQPLIAKRRNRRIGLQDALPSLQSGQIEKEETEMPGDSQAAPLRSIHELREAGGNVRLLSEIDAMLDDVEDRSSSISLKRNRLLELAKRLEEAPVRQLFAENEFVPRLSIPLSQDNDPILQTLFAAAVLNLVSGSQSALVIGHLSSPFVVEVLVKLLKVDESINSIAKARRLNMSKAAQLELKEYWEGLCRSNMWREGWPAFITPRVLGLQCLEYLTRQAQEVGKADRILQQHAIEEIVRLLKTPVAGYPSPPYDTPNTALRLAVSILESCTIALQTHEERDFCTKTTLEPIASLLASMDICFDYVPETLRALTLRLYLNLTNNSPDVCDIFSRADVLRSICNMVISHFEHTSYHPTSDNSRLDTLILALGSLINLAEWNGTVPKLMMELEHEGSSFLEHFVRLFQLNVSKTAEVRKRSTYPTITDYTRLSPKKRLAPMLPSAT